MNVIEKPATAEDDRIRAEGMLVGALAALGADPHPVLLAEALKLVHDPEQASVAIRQMKLSREGMRFETMRDSLRRTNTLMGRK